MAQNVFPLPCLCDKNTHLVQMTVNKIVPSELCPVRCIEMFLEETYATTSKQCMIWIQVSNFLSKQSKHMICHFGSYLSQMLMNFTQIWLILKLAKTQGPKTAVSVLGARPRPRSKVRTLDRLTISASANNFLS